MAEQEYLVSTFGALQQLQGELAQQSTSLASQLAAQQKAGALAQERATAWKAEADRSNEALLRAQHLLEQYVGLLAIHGDVQMAASAGRVDDALMLANERVTRLTQELDRCKEEKKALEGRLHQLENLHAERARLEQELSAAKAERQQTDDERLAPALATAEMWRRRYKETRELLGKSELDAQRRDVEFQMQLSTMSRQLQQCKMQAEKLIKEYQEKERQHQLATPSTLRQQPPHWSVLASNHRGSSISRETPYAHQQQASLQRYGSHASSLGRGGGGTRS